MLFKNESFAKETLSTISYYRLKGYWWELQSDAQQHQFIPNSYFEDVLLKYEFDRELRLVLFYAIEIIEVALRTKMIYHLSQEFGGLWHLNSKIFTDNVRFHHQLEELLNEFARSKEIFVLDFKKKNSPVNSNHDILKNSNNPDAWIIFEVATFGNLSKIYKNLKHQLPQKSVIANEFGLNSHSELSSWLESVAYLRNMVAHHSRVWSRNMVKTPMKLRNPKNNWLQFPITDNQQKKPFYIISAMLYLCNAVNPTHSFKHKMLDLFSRYPNLPLYKIGFNNQWQQEDLWR